MAQMTDTTFRPIKEKLWTKYYFMIIVINLFIFTAQFMMITVIPLYAKHIGGDNSIIGLTMGVFTVSSFLLRPVFGMAVDKWRRKVVLILGCSVFIAGVFFNGFVESISLLLFLRFVQGIGFSANSTAAGTIVADLVPASRLSEGIGYYGIAGTVATAVGPALASFLIDKSGYKIFFFIVVLMMFLAFIIASFLNYEKKEAKHKKLTVLNKNEEPEHGSRLRLLEIFEKDSLPAAVIVLFVAIAFGGVITFLPIFAMSRSIGNIGLFYTVYALGILATRLFSGKIADRRGVTPVILPAMAFMALTLVMLAFTGSLQILLIVAVFLGLSYGTIQPLLNSLILKSCSKDKRGAAIAAFTTANDMGVAISSILWGVVSQRFGFTSVYVSSAVFAIISGVIYIKLYFRRDNI